MVEKCLHCNNTCCPRHRSAQSSCKGRRGWRGFQTPQDFRNFQTHVFRCCFPDVPGQEIKNMEALPLYRTAGKISPREGLPDEKTHAFHLTKVLFKFSRRTLHGPHHSGCLLPNPSMTVTHTMFSPPPFNQEHRSMQAMEEGCISPDGFPELLRAPFRRKWNGISQLRTLNRCVFPKSQSMLTSLSTELQETRSLSHTRRRSAPGIVCPCPNKSSFLSPLCGWGLNCLRLDHTKA